MLSENDVRELLATMCSRLGVCLTAGDVDRLAAAPPESASAFVDEIVRAEWENAGLENDLRAVLEAMVSQAMASAGDRSPLPASG